MAATSTLKLVLDDKEYEASLRSAKQGMADLQQSLQAAGKSFTEVDKQVIDYAKSIGEMETVSKSAKGKLNEMTQTFTELSLQYKKLTDEEKNSPFGMALYDSLDNLKVRIQESKSQLDEVSRSLTGVSEKAENTGGILGALKEKFTVNIDALKLLNIGLQGAEKALNVAKDAFFNNEQNLDEWGRTVESAESVYKGFLSSLNNGDISGFISNIQVITQAARDAFDALDELATFNAFNKANIAGARADLTGAIADYREKTGSKDAVEKASNALIKELETRQQLQADAYKKVVAEVARQRQVNPDDLLKVMTGSWGSFKELNDLEYTGKKTTLVNTGGTYASGGTYRTITEAVPANERERLAQAVKQLHDTEIDNFQSLAEAAKMTEIEINNHRKMVARILSQAESTGDNNGGGGVRRVKASVAGSAASLVPQYSVAGLTEDLRYLQQEQAKATSVEEWETYQDAIRSVNDEIKKLKGELSSLGTDNKTRGIRISGMQGVSISDILPGVKTNLVGMPEQKESPKMLDSMNTMASGMSQLVSGMQQIGITIPQEIQSVIGILQGITTILTAIQTLNSIKFWADGGVVHANSGLLVPGNHFSGDMVPSMINSGELILNQAQQGNLASQLMAASMINGGGGGGHDYVSGQNIFLGTNNYLKGSGQGQLVTTRMLRQYNLIS